MRVLWLFRTLMVVGAALPFAVAQEAKLSKYPLRLHILAIDETHPTMRMQPAWCSGSVPSFGGDVGGNTGEQGIPCGGSSGGYTSFGGPDDFAGGGRGDLVTPPEGGAQALNFSYEGCNRIRVAPGFHALQARWKKSGRLEVMIPTEAITGSDRPMPMQKCTLKATLHEFVYLRMPDGGLVKVTQEAYLRKPSLRVFLSGAPTTLQPRTPATVSVRQLMLPPQ